MNICVLGNWDPKEHGFKESTKEGIGVYERRDMNLRTVIPLTYPEKFKHVPLSISLSDVIVVVVDSKIDPKLVGEIALIVESAGIPVATVDNGFHMWDNFRSMLISKNIYSSFFDAVESLPEPKYGDKPIVFVDQGFVVSGKGNVVLGFVKSGEIEKHMILESFEMGEVSIKSIQINGRNVDKAVSGDRVGLLLKSSQAPNKDVLSDEISKFSKFKWSWRHNFSESQKPIISSATIQSPSNNFETEKPVPKGDWKTFAFSNDVFPRFLGIVEPDDD